MFPNDSIPYYRLQSFLTFSASRIFILAKEYMREYTTSITISQFIVYSRIDADNPGGKLKDPSVRQRRSGRARRARSPRARRRSRSARTGSSSGGSRPKLTFIGWKVRGSAWQM